MKAINIILIVLVWILISVVITTWLINQTKDIKLENTTQSNQTTKCSGAINLTGNCGVDDYLTYKYITTNSLSP